MDDPDIARDALASCDNLRAFADSAKARGDFALAANVFLNATIAARRIWTPVRLYCLERFEDIVMEDLLFSRTLTKENFEKLTSLAEDKLELTVIRSRALFVLGANATAEGQLDLSAKYKRSVIDVIEECHAKARSGSPPGAVAEWDSVLDHFFADGTTQVSKPMGEYLETVKENARRVLNQMENATDHDCLKGMMMQLAGSDVTLLQRLGAGGGKCDCCGKKAEQMENGELFQCSRCKRAYYCSSDCQKRRWKSGHKHACRAPGQIEPGDIMLVKGIVSKPELNRKLVKVIRAATTEGRWEVNVQGSNGTISLASNNLVHIRPAK